MSVLSPIQLGTAARALELMGIGQDLVQATINDPIQRSVVAAAYRGEVEATNITPTDWVARELAVSTELAKYGLPALNEYHVEYASKGTIGIHCRLVPVSWTLETMFPFFNSWNEVESNPKVKLYHGRDSEWWRTNKSVQHLPTKAGVLNYSFSQVMQPTDLAGRPFFLNAEEQTAWAKEQGGSGPMSAEQVVYLYIRSVVERKLPLWAAGSVRCCNSYGSDNSLSVDWYADYGFCVYSCSRSGRDWNLGAVPEVSLFYFTDFIQPPSMRPISCNFSSKDRYLFIGMAFKS